MPSFWLAARAWRSALGFSLRSLVRLRMRPLRISMASSAQPGLYGGVALEGCACGHKLAFCHKVNAATYCGGEAPVEDYRAALIRCAELAGADISGGVPTWPNVQTWAVQAVATLRRDYDEESRKPRFRGRPRPQREDRRPETCRTHSHHRTIARARCFSGFEGADARDFYCCPAHHHPSTPPGGYPASLGSGVAQSCTLHPFVRGRLERRDRERVRGRNAVSTEHLGFRRRCHRTRWSLGLYRINS